MKRFKELICQYPTAFLLPGNPLRAVQGFKHRIDTGDAPPVYSHPYKKSPLNSEQSKPKSNGCLNSR